MGEAGLVGVHKPAKTKTTFPAETPSPVPDLVSRWFKPGRPDLVWCGDITYVPTGEGWLYVASVLDLGSRRLLGYSMAGHMRTELVTNALNMAVDLRGGQVAGIVMHADRGSQYMSAQHRQRLAELDMLHSVGRVGACWDNSVAEAFWGSLKRETRRQVPIRDTLRRPQSDLRLVQPVQPPATPLSARLPATHRVGNPVRSPNGRSGRVTQVTGQRGQAQWNSLARGGSVVSHLEAGRWSASAAVLRCM